MSAQPQTTQSADLSSSPELEAIQGAGIVGLGGGGFPAHAKYRFPADTIIANGAECEPLLWSDKQLLLRQPEDVVAGVEAVMGLTGARRGIIAVKGKYDEIVAGVESAIRARGAAASGLEVYRLRNVYPTGDEFFLVQEVLGRTIPEMGLPLHRGVVVNNVATLAAIARALQQGEGLTSHLVTVTGEVHAPCVVDAPLGTPLFDLVAAAGGVKRADAVLVAGGPMMGRVADDPDDPVQKTTSGLLVLPPDHPVVQRKQLDPKARMRLARAACCLCMSCTEVCPRNALGHRIFPHRLMQAVSAGLTRDQEAYLGALLCCECGLCTTFGCPLFLDPCGMNIAVKAELRQAGVEFPARDQSEPSPFWPIKQVPTPRLVARLQLTHYDRRLELLDRPLAPGRVRLRLQQGPGQPARPEVTIGQTVAQGQRIAGPGGQISVALHASIDGVVAEVTDTEVVIQRGPEP